MERKESIVIDEQSGSILFGIRVVPRASKTEVSGVIEGLLKIRISSPPVDGAANAEIIKFFSKKLKIAKSNIEIVSGQTSKAKRIRISGVTAEQLLETVLSETGPSGNIV